MRDSSNFCREQREPRLVTQESHDKKDQNKARMFRSFFAHKKKKKLSRIHDTAKKKRADLKSSRFVVLIVRHVHSLVFEGGGDCPNTGKRYTSLSAHVLAPG